MENSNRRDTKEVKGEREGDRVEKIKEMSRYSIAKNDQYINLRGNSTGESDISSERVPVSLSSFINTCMPSFDVGTCAVQQRRLSYDRDTKYTDVLDR